MGIHGSLTRRASALKESPAEERRGPAGPTVSSSSSCLAANASPAWRQHGSHAPQLPGRGGGGEAPMRTCCACVWACVGKGGSVGQWPTSLAVQFMIGVVTTSGEA